ncbi:MAG TPA: TlpA disulfide reductase family protein [Ktedonobacterales bacterium]
MLIAAVLTIATIVLLALALLSPARAEPDNSTRGLAAAAKIGRLAPDVTLMGLDGRPVSVSSLRGKVVILNFWYIACDGCRTEFPALEQAYQAHSAEGLVILGVNPVDSAKDMKTFATATSLTYPVVADASQRTVITYNVTKTPSSYVIDRHGVIRYLSVGPLDHDTIENVTRPLLIAK